MDRSILKSQPVQHNASSCAGNSPKTFDMITQQYGTFFSGFQWQLFGCGTYRNRSSVAAADGLLDTFFDRLRKTVNAPIAYIAVPERRTSGCGYPAIPLHWHFVAAVPPRYTLALLREATCLWQRPYGNSHIRQYDSRRSGAHYLAKLAGSAGYSYRLQNP